jgi:hypothetical protein
VKWGISYRIRPTSTASLIHSTRVSFVGGEADALTRAEGIGEK